MKTAIERFTPLVLAGAPGPAAELRRSLVGDGDPNAVRDLSGSPLAREDVREADVLVYVVEGAASGDDEEALRLAARNGVERVCLVLADRPTHVSSVDPEDAVTAPPGGALPVARIAERIAERAGEKGFVLASKLPPLRRPVAERIVRRFAKQNGVLGAAIFLPGADLPALTLNQIRMVFQIAGAYGEQIDRDRAVELLGVVGVGFGLRAVARQALGFVPGPGWALKGGVAYAGTRAVGKAAIRYFEAGGAKRLRQRVTPPRQG